MREIFRLGYGVGIRLLTLWLVLSQSRPVHGIPECTYRPVYIDRDICTSLGLGYGVGTWDLQGLGYAPCGWSSANLGQSMVSLNVHFDQSILTEIYVQAKSNKRCGVFLPFLSPKMMLHGVVYSPTFQEFFVLAKLKILSNLVQILESKTFF